LPFYIYNSVDGAIYQNNILKKLEEKPVLILANLMLGIEFVNPIYYGGIKVFFYS
jgi:hypothetical protein